MDFQIRKVEQEFKPDGGKGLFVRRPRGDEWKEWYFMFQIISPNIGWVQHAFPIIDNSNIPSRDDGTKSTWAFVPCLGSPKDQSSLTIEYDAEGVAECRSITIPGTDIPLHDCEKVTKDGKSGQTTPMYRCMVLNWTTETIQILDLKPGGWETLFEDVARLKDKYGEKFNIVNYTMEAKCVPLRGAAPFRYDLGVVSDPEENRSAQDVKAWIEADQEHREQYEKANQALSPLMTAADVRRAIGAHVSEERKQQAAEVGNIFGEMAVDDDSADDSDPFAGPSPGTANQL